MLLLANFTFKIALGPIGFTIVGEIPSGRVRAQTIVLGRICYVAGGLAVDQLIPRMINPTAWNLKAKTGFFFLGCDVVLFVYQWFRLAETRVSPQSFRKEVADLRIVPLPNLISCSRSKFQPGSSRSIRSIVSLSRSMELTEAYELSQVQGHPVQSAVEEERRNDAKIDVVERETVAGLAR